MKSKHTLSVAPYFGGKSRMADFIIDRLNYDDSDIFVTPFGGMCRVLLNKPRHKVECYNDYSSGLTALMSILSNQDSANVLISRLLEETEHSKEIFDHHKKIFDYVETDLEQQTKNELKKFLTDAGVTHPSSCDKFVDTIKSQVQSNDIQKNQKALADKLSADDDFKNKFEHLFSNWLELYYLKEEQGGIERTNDIGNVISDMDIAIATFVVFQQSRDGMGKVWSKEKFKSNHQYIQQIYKLDECANRLEGVEVYQIDAMDFFRNWDSTGKITIDKYSMLEQWLDNPQVMMYCDPSYISVEDEIKLLGDIDISSVETATEAIMKANKGKLPKNLGKIYAKSFGYEDQENFLRCIQKANCRMIVSNYDLQLYNKYLNSNTGWRKEEFVTTTGVGGKANNSRIEVIWYNF